MSLSGSWRMHWNCARAAAWGLALAALGATPCRAYINDLRITEVDPYNEKIEVTNMNGAMFQLTSEIPVPYNFDLNNYKQMGLVPGMVFPGNGIWVVELPELGGGAGDCWLYSNSSYESPSALIHGVQWGTPPPERCNSEVAALAGKWPGKSASAPVPPPGCTLAWDGDGYTPLDWYVDSTPTMGKPNDTAPGTVNDPFEGPNASQVFEKPALGDQVTALEGWTMSGASGRFGVRFACDVSGRSGARPGSSSNRWLRIRDTDPDGDNAFSSPILALDPVRGYRCAFYVNQEVAPLATGARPTLALQVYKGDGEWADAWGVRFQGSSVEAAVLDGGGNPDSAPLYSLSGATGVGQWVKIVLQLDLANKSLAASANGGKPVTLPIEPAGNPLLLRLAYQGGGAGNMQDMLLDDVAFSPYSPPVLAVGPWGSFE